MVTFLVLPSPLLPALAYDGLVAALAEAGGQASMAPAEMAAGEGAHDLIRRWAALVGDDGVLVPHSNAGLLAPSVRAFTSDHLPIVFVDAALSPPAGDAPLAPPDLRALLAGLADDTGVLPPWTRWWSREDLADVVPADAFGALDASCPRLPLHYFDARVAAPPGWADGPNAYLAFGATYADEYAFAAGRGWPHARIDGDHLHFLDDPSAVAAQVVELAEQLPS